MKKLATFLFPLMFFALASCSTAKIYRSPQAENIVKRHRVVAIAPPKVTIAARRKVEADAIKEQEKNESLNFQNEIYSWILKRKMKGHFTIDVLDVETTNAKLKRAGFSDDNPLTPVEMCETLGADGIITSSFALDKPISEGAAVAIAVLTGWGTSTNKVTANLAIYDKKTKKMIWSYNDKISGSIGSSPSKLIDYLMRQASKKMPYYKK